MRARHLFQVKATQERTMKIGIIGAGNIGSALAGYFHKLQHIVWIANSRVLLSLCFSLLFSLPR